MKSYRNIFLCFDWVHSLRTCLTTEGTYLQKKIKGKEADLTELKSATCL